MMIYYGTAQEKTLFTVVPVWPCYEQYFKNEATGKQRRISRDNLEITNLWELRTLGRALSKTCRKIGEMINDTGRAAIIKLHR